MRQCQDECRSLSGGVPKNLSLHWMKKNKLASLEATLVRNSAHSLTHLLTGVKCRATSVAKKIMCVQYNTLHYTFQCNMFQKERCLKWISFLFLQHVQFCLRRVTLSCLIPCCNRGSLVQSALCVHNVHFISESDADTSVQCYVHLLACQLQLQFLQRGGWCWSETEGSYT